MTTPSAPPRTLTQMLRDWDDRTLGDLLMARPDLAFPTPTEFSQVASLATTRASVSAALNKLNRVELWVARVACDATGSLTLRGLVDATGVDEDDAPVIEAAGRRLLSLALLWGDLTALRPVRALDSALAEGRLPSTKPDSLRPPLPTGTTTRSTALVDQVAAGSAFEFVRHLDVLIEHFDHRPAKLTRQGEVSTRDLRVLATLLDIPSNDAKAMLEIAMVAGLVSVGAAGVDEVLLPTPEFDDWQRMPLERQWAHVADAWLTSPSLGGDRELKSLAFAAFGEPGAGTVLDVPQVREWLAWHRPRTAPNGDRQATLLLTQAAALGLTGLGALAGYAVPPRPDDLAALLPARVDSVVLQADLTAIATGPLTPDAAHELGAIADVESRGTATVYRFSAESLTRARTFGWSSTEILAVLQKRSETPVPQPLEYLVRDLDRAGIVGVGHSPAAPIGGIGGHGSSGHRVPRRATRPPSSEDHTAADRLDPAGVMRVLTSLRSAEVIDADAPALPTYAENFLSVPVDTLREAAETGEPIWIGFVDTRGDSGERVVLVSHVDDGVVSAVDKTTSDSLTIPLHRITAAHILRTNA